MKYNFASPAEVDRASEYLKQLIEKKSIVEIKKVSPRRSLNQNSFLHLLLSAFGSHFGFTDAEAKIFYKRLNENIYIYEKGGMKFLKSSADLTTEDMAKSITKLREYSAEQGYPLPTATDEAWIRQLENTIENNKYYL